MYVVTGATGHTGSVVADALLAAGKKVRVIGRDAKRLERFTHKGAEAFVADATDAAAITNAFSGAEAAYLMIPPYEARVGDSLVSAVNKNALKHAVVLSSYGADKPDRTGPVVGLHNFEKKLEGVAGLNALYLRAGYFMENLLPQIRVINSFGFMAGPVRADLPLPMIATHDVGAVAAEALLKLNFQGEEFPRITGTPRRHLHRGGEGHRRSDWEARPYLSTVARSAAEAHLPTDGHVSQQCRPLARNGRSPEYKTPEDARTSLVRERHSDDA